MQLPGVAVAFPDHDVLAWDFGYTAFTRNAEDENANLPSDIAAGIHFNGMKMVNLHPLIESALPKGLNGRTAIYTLPTGWEKSRVHAVEASNG